MIYHSFGIIESVNCEIIEPSAPVEEKRLLLVARPALKMPKFLIIAILCCVAVCRGVEFENAFKNCHVDVQGFDGCVREGLNAIRPFFKTGLSKYNVAPFDPFFAREVTVTRGLPNLGFTLTLRNVTETGWSASKVTKFVSDLPNYKVVYTQSFPEKFLAGDYEFKGTVFGPRMTNQGKFTLALYDLVQTTTITKEPGAKVKVRVEVQTIRDLSLHITNLLFGRQILEGMLDRVINGVWQPGFMITKPIINDLVSSAFTEIFGKAFQNFPLEKVIRPKPSVTARVPGNST